MTSDQLEEEMNKLTVRQLLLLRFIQSAHGDQVRKYTGEPYFHHVLEVGVMAENYVKDSLLLEVGLCHDLFEDTKITYSVLYEFLKSIGYSRMESEFIARGTDHLSDKYTAESLPGKNRAQRKMLEANRLGAISWLFQTVKYADLINNTLSIVEHDASFAPVYLAEKETILQKMRHGDIELFIKCWETLKQAKNKLTTNV